MEEILLGLAPNTGTLKLLTTKSIIFWTPSFNPLLTLKLGGLKGFGVFDSLVTPCTNSSFSAQSPITFVTSSGGAITSGTHSYYYTVVINGNESLLSVKSAVVDNTTNKTNTLTIPIVQNIPVGFTGTITRNIYRSKAGDVTPCLLTSISDNATVTYVDTIADTSLTTSSPTTSNVYISTYSEPDVTLTESHVVQMWQYRLNPTVDETMGVQNVMVQNMPTLPPSDTQVGIVSETNLAVTTYPYWRTIEMGKFYEWALQYKITCSTASTRIKIYGTLDPDAAVPADNSDGPSVDWTDITYATYGKPTILAPTAGTGKDCQNVKPVRFQRIMISILPKNATNFTQFNLVQA